MWIRSQRRNTLVNINFMRVINDGNYCLICGATTDGCDCELGVYSTEEKALKVLDEIQTSIMTEHQFRIDELNCTRNYFGKEYKEIYQMPQDEDVEV